ncbi:MAG: serine/threonine protein kinase [Bradymonadia bacterium]|jgi:serine/threonine protein kinase
MHVAANEDSLWPGQLLDGAYAIEAEVVRGGMGRVYRARDVDLDRLVAVKVMPGTQTHDLALVEQFRREARGLASLSHPNVVAVFDVARKGVHPYIVMRWIKGQTLNAEIGPPMPSPRVLRIAEQIAAGLTHAHQRGLSHLDIKPANVMIDAGDHVTVIDFGLGLMAADARPNVQGTAAFMAPEQLTPGARLGPTADVYAVGALIYTLRVGAPPFEGSSAVDICQQHLNAPPPSIVGEPALTQIVHHAMAKDPDMRPSMQALGRALRNLQPSERRVGRVLVNRALAADPPPSYVSDVSWTGCFITTANPPPVGTRVTLFHPIIDAGGHVLAGIAEVHRRRPDGMGLKYLRLSEVGYAAISAVLDKTAPPKP